ncbi:MAG: transketolase family protein [Thermotaleaceae bacterium]
MKSPRDVFGEVLIELGKKDERIVVLNGDLATSTKTIHFQKKFPKRHFNMGICEQHMMSVAGGMASEGFVPIVSTFAVFAAGRAYDQIRQCIAYPRNNVKIMATHPGLAVGADGATHQALEDIALMRALPNMTVLAPSDEIETRQAIEKAVAWNGPVYIRIGRAELPRIQDQSYCFEIGKGSLVKEGRDVTIVSHGIMTWHAIESAKLLAKEGIEAEVISMAAIKPLDKEIILQSAKKTKAVMTLEDHSIYGGLGSAVAEAVTTTHPVWMDIMGVEDAFGQSGTVEELFGHYGLDRNTVVKRIKKLLVKKGKIGTENL